MQASSPYSTLDHHPDLYFYGIHGVEAPFAVMAPGRVSVSRKTEGDADVATRKWQDGRVGAYHNVVGKGGKQPMIRIWGAGGGTVDSKGAAGYDGVVRAIAEFFHTGKPPVEPAETAEIFEFMSAAQLSKDRGGAEVQLKELRK